MPAQEEVKFFRFVFFPAVITVTIYAVIAYAASHSNNDYQLNSYSDMSVNNNVFAHRNLPYETHNSGR